MPHVTFVYPCIGRFPHTRYVRSWQMQPLTMAVLAGITPPEWRYSFYDDRLEPVDYDRPTDLAAISIETYTARRGYQIAGQFRRRGVQVVLGGYHATFCPTEALAHADAVCVGQAEGVWPRILASAAAGTLGGIYSDPRPTELAGIAPDRRIFHGKNYFNLALVETGRGCGFQCTFCSIAAFYGAACRRRPAQEIVREIRALGQKKIFFVDDNIVADIDQAKALFQALQPLGIRWISQASLNAVADGELLDLMARSGCAGLLIGFETLSASTLAGYGKKVNQGIDFSAALRTLRDRGIVVYGTFMFGAGRDGFQTLRETVRFAVRQKLFIAAFAHVVPFPGTPLYRKCEREGKLIYDKWWLSERYRFGEPPYRPAAMPPKTLERLCLLARRRFFSFPSILRRARDLRANCKNLANAQLYFGTNLLLRREIDAKHGLPLGLQGFADESGVE
jgi:radical SAM superfamily enzyme YgiQ (UPF0313 family)